jgi:hypothetical protein
MVSIKILLATWMAVFLALPSCPCQLFESLGMEFPHKHEVGTSSDENADYNGIIELETLSKVSDQELPVCHCEEGIGKTAEECSECELDAPTQWASMINDDASSCELNLFFESASARAPPPEMLMNYWLKSARTGWPPPEKMIHVE